MKVLHINTHFNTGGITNYIISLSEAFRSIGSGPEIIVASSGGDSQNLLDAIGVKHFTIDIGVKFEFHPKVFLSAIKLARLIRSESVDIIHAHSRVSQVAARLASALTGVPYVTTCHGYFRKRSRGIFDTWGAKVIAISQAVKDHLIKDLNVNQDRIELIYNAVNHERFLKNYSESEIKKFKATLGLETDKILIGTVGRLSPVKGQKYLIEAMKGIIYEYKNCECLIVGSGGEENALKDLARYLGLEKSVRFLPQTADTPDILAIMDIFVFPSVKEGFGIALIEAMAAGRACVASRTGGIENIINDGRDGILCAVGDIKAIRDSVLKLIRDDGLRSEMGRAASKKVKDNFSIELMARGISELYRKAAG